jgi:alpha-L-fucosidase
MSPTRRDCLKLAGLGAGALLLPGQSARGSSAVPRYLQEHAASYVEDPRQAAAAWFADARYGLFLHYGVYSLLARGEWVMLQEAIPLAEYSKLKDRFTADGFDADFITDLALDAGMKYVNLTAKHHDGFSLFRTRETDFNSLNSPAKRDLVGELAEACDRKGLGFFAYYSLFADWRHPYFYSRDAGWANARPDYSSPEPTYRFEKDEDFAAYLEFATRQIRELLTQYEPLSGVWLDPIMGYYHRPDLFPIEDLYRMIRSLQPHTLISAKQGANGDEDFAAPERSGHSIAERLENLDLRAHARKAWDRNQHKHNEICDTLQPRVWGYKKDDAGRHATPDEIVEKLQGAWKQDCNLLLNTGPLPDGSIDATDEATLREVGRRLRAGVV